MRKLSRGIFALTLSYLGLLPGCSGTPSGDPATGGAVFGGAPNLGDSPAGGSSKGGTASSIGDSPAGGSSKGGTASSIGGSTSLSTGSPPLAGGASQVTTTGSGGVTSAKGGASPGSTSASGGATTPNTSTTAPATTGPYHWSSVALGGGGFVSAVIASLTEKNVFYARTDVGGLYRWNESLQSWEALTDFASDTQTGFLGVEAVALDPQAPSKLYALVGISYFNGGKTAILRSSDYGKTFSVTEVTSQFKAHGNGLGRQNGERLAVDPNLGNVLFCGTRRNGLFKSTDSGITWNVSAGLPVTTTANDNGVSFVLLDGSSGTKGTATPRIFAGISRLGSANIYVSTDAGASFSPIAGAPATNLMPQRAALASNGTLYVTYANGAGPSGNASGTEPMNLGAIWKYNVAAGAWANVTPTGITAPFSGISVDAANPNHLVATTINTYWAQPWGWGDHIYVSTNGGAAWTDLVSGTKPTMDANGMPWIAGHAIHWAGTATFDPFNSERVWVTSGNGIFATNNLSAQTSTWKFMAKGLEETVPLEAVSIPGYGLASVIGDYDGFVTTDVTISPPAGTHKPAIGSTGGLAQAGAAPGTMVRVGASMYRTTNSGATWTQVPLTGTTTGGTVALAADGGVILWTPNGSTTTYRTANNGTQWTAVTGLTANLPVIADSSNASKFYAYSPTAGTFYASTNGGVSFAQVSTPGTSGAWKMRAAPGIEGNVWLPLYGGGLTRSTNSGTTFTKVVGVQRADAVGFGKAAAGATFPTVFIWGVANGGPVGIYRSIDAGATFTRVNDDQHQFGGPGNGKFIVGDLNVYGRVYMSSAGRGIVYGEPN